jgi:oligoendopeptidase F
MPTAPLHPLPAADAGLLRSALEQALVFAALHRGHIATYDAAALAEALERLETVQDAIAEAEAVAAHDPDGAEWLAEVETLTLFFDREWEALPDTRAERLIADPRLAGYAHFLRVARRMPAEHPTEAEDRLLADQAISRAVARILAGSRAWT